MSVLKFSFVLLVFLGLASQFFVPIVLAQTSEAEAASALVTSENAVVSAYQAVSKAEEAGANVSSLLVRLNEAGWFLDRARMAYKSGDFDSTGSLATLCNEKLDGFVDDAELLEREAFRQQFLNTVIFVVSVIAAVVVFFISVVAWFILNRKSREDGR